MYVILSGEVQPIEIITGYRLGCLKKSVSIGVGFCKSAKNAPTTQTATISYFSQKLLCIRQEA